MAARDDVADEILRAAREELQKGPWEDPPGSNCTRYGKWYPFPCVAWCAQFVSYVVIEKCGIDVMPRFQFTPAGAQWFMDREQWFEEDPRPGDLVFYNFPDTKDRIQHVGFVVDGDGSTIRAVEGNTSLDAGGSQDNGGVVAIKQRPMAHVVGFGRLPAAGKPEVPSFKFKAKASFGRGDAGADVRAWQADLNRWMSHLARYHSPGFRFELDVDGDFGPATHKATMTFQQWTNRRRPRLDVDGEVGRRTIEVMERVRTRQRAHEHGEAGDGGEDDGD
ncbi:MAG TPA: peptidoglycan-binding protein [Actinomycetota bacterium]|nr:peptidoglycan-binding protein [Actinomycetota bacterium]